MAEKKNVCEDTPLKVIPIISLKQQNTVFLTSTYYLSMQEMIDIPASKLAIENPNTGVWCLSGYSGTATYLNPYAVI